MTLNVAVPVRTPTTECYALSYDTCVVSPIFSVHLTLRGAEIPADAVSVGVKSDFDGLVEDPVGGLLDALRRTAIAGDLAEQAVKRDGRVSHADHAGEEADAGNRDGHVRPSLAPCPSDRTVHLRLHHIGRFMISGPNLASVAT